MMRLSLFFRRIGLSLKMPPEEEEPRDVVRDRAKKITAKRQANYIEGRIGLIIDGTGRDYDKITKHSYRVETTRV